MRRRLIAALCAVTATVTMTAGCTDSPSPATFVLALNSAPGSLDPQLSSLGVVRQVSYFLYDSLVRDVGGHIVAGLASTWSESGTGLTFRLHHHVRCADGHDLTASDVAANVNWVADPAHGSPLRGRAVPAGVRASANDTRGTVTLRAAPTGFLLDDLAQLPIVCAAGMRHRNSLVDGSDGTGPYRLTSARTGDRYALARREDYAWGPPGTHVASLPARIVITVVEDETTAANMLLTGQVNSAVVAGPDRSRLARSRATPHPARLMYGELLFNERAGRPTASERVRRGLVRALDLTQLRDAGTAGLGTTPQTLLGDSPCPSSHVTTALAPHDTDAARHDLAGVRPLTLLYQVKHGAQGAAAAELAVAQWHAAGVQVVAHAMTDAQLFSTVFSDRGWDILMAPIDGPTPIAEQGTFSGPTPQQHGSDFAAIVNPAYDRAAAVAARQPERMGCGSWAVAERALAGHSDVVPFAVLDEPVWTSGATLTTEHGYVLPWTVRLTR